MVLLLWLPILMLQAAQPSQPPTRSTGCGAPEHRQFDFWLGEWDVVPHNAPATGRPPARNTITSVQDGCALAEQWRASTNTGQSLNVYDRSRGQWHQTWVDNSGGLHEYWGRLEGANMVFTGTTPTPSNAAVRMQVRMTFFNLGEGRVRQLSEQLNADGSWSVNYDLLYTRRAQ